MRARSALVVAPILIGAFLLVGDIQAAPKSELGTIQGGASPAPTGDGWQAELVYHVERRPQQPNLVVRCGSWFTEQLLGRGVMDATVTVELPSGATRCDAWALDEGSRNGKDPVFITGVLVFDVVAAGVIPCGDPRGCPDLVLDGDRMLVLDPDNSNFDAYIDTQTFTETDCAVQEGEVPAADRTLYHFSTVTINSGGGAFEVPDPVLYPDLLAWAPCHGHYHFKDYVAYRLWTPAGYRQWKALQRRSSLSSEQLLAANPDIAAQMVAGHKQGFCIVDFAQYGFNHNKMFELPSDQWDTSTQLHNGCEYPYSGLDPTWADTYWAGLEAQWIDITGLPGGRYVLENEINPARVIEESDYGNNAAAVTVTVP